MSIHKRTLKDGTIEFRNDNGDLHYLDGPAVIYPNGDDEYWWHGKMQSKQDHDLNLMKLQQELSFIGNNTNKQNNNMNEQRKMIKEFKQYLNKEKEDQKWADEMNLHLDSVKENNRVMKESVSTKDWTRMLDLQLAGKDGSGIASTLKNKDKAIARYVAGTKLAGEDMKYNDGSFQQFYGSFSEFGDQALKLGATIQEIKDIFDNTEIPQKFVDKQKGASGKKLGSFVGRISKLVLDSGLDIEYQKYHGDALTNAGKDAMETNGRKWTIGYKADVIYNGEKYYLEFDAITDEGVDSTLIYYVLSHNSDKVFTNNFYNDGTSSYDKMGVRDFLTKLKFALEEIKNPEPVVTEHKLYTSINEFKKYLMVKESVKISTKDWNRMLDLQLAEENGSGVAGTLKNKDKAIARYVAGTKLAGETVDISDRGYVSGTFSEFGEKALELGATKEEIQDTFDNTEIPQSILDKEKSLSSKNLGSWVVGNVSKVIIKNGADINYIKSGNALTHVGQDAMNNGIIWTIGYINELIVNGQKYQFDFDAITSEAVDDTRILFVLADSTDRKIRRIFDEHNERGDSKIGIREFSSLIKKTIEKIDVPTTVASNESKIRKKKIN